MTLKIHNFRIGFATNSSSSHSVVLIPPALIGRISAIDSAGGWGDADGYGWDYFRLVTPEQKIRYLAAQFIGEMREDVDAIRKIAERIDVEVPGYADEISRLIEKSDGSYLEMPSVDHQSVYRFDKQTMQPEIIDGLIRFFKSDQVVVLGGNDNDDGNDHIMPEGAQELTAFQNAMTDGDGKVRIKMEGPYWTFFNGRNGTKARITLEDVPDYVKSITPELVDLKITDYCGRGCNFCAPPDTEISMSDGSVKAISQVKPGDLVKAFDGSNFTDLPVEETYERPYEGDLIEIEMEDGRILRLTPEHEVLTIAGWKLAGDLLVDEEIIHFC